MASTYSPNLRLELIGTGEQQGSWGATTNVNLGTLLEEAIGGYVSVTVSDAGDTTLTANNGSADQSRNMVINLTGALTATRNVICPAIEKVYIVKNATTGSQSVVFKVSGQTGVTITNGSTVIVYVDGTDVRQVTATTGTIASQNSNNVTITGGSITGLSNISATGGAISNASLSNVVVVANASSLSVRDADGSNTLSFAVGSNLTANTTLTLTTGGTTNRTLDISASNVTISTAGAALIDDADAGAQRVTMGAAASGSITTSNLTQNTARVLGRSTANAGAIEEISVGTGLSLSGGTLSATASGGGNYAMQAFTNTTPGGTTWTKPAGLVAIKVTVVAGGGGLVSTADTYPASGAGGAAISYIPAASIPGPVTVTVGAGGGTTAPTTGGTSSFGAFCSATGGSGGSPGSGAAAGSGGAGTGGTINTTGGNGEVSIGVSNQSGPGYAKTSRAGKGGGSIFGGEGAGEMSFGIATPSGVLTIAGKAATSYGGGASGKTNSSSSGAGFQGIVIVEEFY